MSSVPRRTFRPFMMWVAAAGVVCVAGTHSFAQDAPGYSESLAIARDLAARDAGGREPGWSAAEQDAAASLFRRALVRMAELRPERVTGSLESVEGSGLEQKLLFLANDRHQRPERYAQIERYYMAPPAEGARAHLAPRLLAAHADQEFRAVFEFLLLAPAPARAPDLVRHRAREAISRIADARSIITLERCYEIAGRGASGDVLSSEQDQVLAALGRMGTREAVASMLRVRRDAARTTGPRRSSVEDRVLEILADTRELGRRAQFRALILDHGHSLAADAADAAFLQRVVAAADRLDRER